MAFAESSSARSPSCSSLGDSSTPAAPSFVSVISLNPPQTSTATAALLRRAFPGSLLRSALLRRAFLRPARLLTRGLRRPLLTRAGLHTLACRRLLRCLLRSLPRDLRAGFLR